MWDNAARPVLEVASGETAQLQCADASGGQLNAQSTAQDVATLDLTIAILAYGDIRVATRSLLGLEGLDPERDVAVGGGRRRRVRLSLLCRV